MALLSSQYSRNFNMQYIYFLSVCFLFIRLLVHVLYLVLLKQHSLSIGASKFGISFPELARLRSAVEITGGHAFRFINEERVSAVIMLVYLWNLDFFV